MESSATTPLTHTFVVRVWFEVSASLPGGGEWRGSVRDAVSGEVVHFRYLEGLVGALHKLRDFTS
jgi:hypothetical protein